MRKITSIHVDFPVAVRMPIGFQQALWGLIDMVCRTYDSDNPGRSMRPQGWTAKDDQAELFIDVGEMASEKWFTELRASPGPEL